MKKKTTALLLAMSMVLALAACGGNGGAASSKPAGSSPAASTPAASTPAASTPAAGDGDVVKAVYCASMNNESQAFAYKMFQKHEAEFNMKIDVLDDQGDAAKQAENVQQAAAQGYSGSSPTPAMPPVW